MELQPPRTTRRDRRSARLAAGLAAVFLAGLLGGCGVRLETSPPAEPKPDATEQVRRTAVADALGVAELAESARATAGLPDPVSTELSRVATDAHAQADALGGLYHSGLAADPGIEPSPTATTTPPPATPADVVGALVDAAGRSRTAATTTTGGDLARLVASIGASQTVSAVRLADLAGVPGPDPVSPVVPEPVTATASPSPSPGEPGGVATTPPGAQDAVPPEGLSASDYRALVLAEDGARFALEVRAARTSGEARARLLALSREHGERAQAWAVLGGVAGTDQDPRRVAYAVPRDDDDAALVRALAHGLATDYASLVGTTAASTRGALVDLLVESAVTLNTWGAAPTPFPGMPELAG
ncbi:DUF4439 domain-containing protein [Xylanimonas sp. McL0601]|uniref:DUF4439 domain-containing protein n=1 Tax=Xylanimonas sp. McL0601 TaxID=3414739 RepID=UPI003CE6F8F2